MIAHFAIMQTASKDYVHWAKGDAREQSGTDLSEELLFQLVGPAFVGGYIRCQMTNVCTLQQQLQHTHQCRSPPVGRQVTRQHVEVVLPCAGQAVYSHQKQV